MKPLFLILAYACQSAYAGTAHNLTSGVHCKVTPTSPFWPSSSDWAQFNQTLGGTLLKPGAPAEACHTDHAAFDAQVCIKLQGHWDSSQWHSDNPTSSLWQNVNSYSCLPDSKYPCSTTGYPVYVVNASTSDHVQAAVNLARERKLRLNVKSTGHDFLGLVHSLVLLEITPGWKLADVSKAICTAKIFVDMDASPPWNEMVRLKLSASRLQHYHQYSSGRC